MKDNCVCLRCAFFHGDQNDPESYNCTSFLEIPQEILDGTNKHEKVMENQLCDRVFMDVDDIPCVLA